MLLVLIIVVCAAFVLLAGFGTFTALSRGRSRRSLETGAEARTRRPALKAPPGRPAGPTAPPRRAPVEAPREAGAATEAEAVTEVRPPAEPEAPPEHRGSA